MVKGKSPLASRAEQPVSAGSSGTRRSVGRPQTNGRPNAESAGLLVGAMQAKSVTVSQAAAALGVSGRTVTGWRSGDRGPSVEEAEKLAALLDRPELPGWWEWPPGAARAATPLAGSPQQSGPAPKPPRIRRWALLTVVVVVLVGLAVAAAFALRPADRSTAVEQDATAAAQPSQSGGRLDGGPTVSVGALSCSRPVRVPAAATVEETQGTLGATTFTNPAQICGAGPKIAAGSTVRVVCRLLAPQMSSVVPDGYWYLVAVGPNRGRFAAANTFLNGDPPGAGNLTNTDVTVPRCVVG